MYLFPVPVTLNTTPTTEMMVTETTATRTSVINPTETTVADETTTSHTKNSVIDTTAHTGKGFADYSNYMMLHRCAISELKM